MVRVRRPTALRPRGGLVGDVSTRCGVDAFRMAGFVVAVISPAAAPGRRQEARRAALESFNRNNSATRLRSRCRSRQMLTDARVRLLDPLMFAAFAGQGPVLALEHASVVEQRYRAVLAVIGGEPVGNVAVPGHAKVSGCGR